MTTLVPVRRAFMTLPTTSSAPAGLVAATKLFRLELVSIDIDSSCKRAKLALFKLDGFPLKLLENHCHSFSGLTLLCWAVKRI